MGQARQRGTLGERIEQSKARQIEEARKRVAGIARAEANLKRVSDALRAADPTQVQVVDGNAKIVADGPDVGHRLARVIVGSVLRVGA